MFAHVAFRENTCWCFESASNIASLRAASGEFRVTAASGIMPRARFSSIANSRSERSSSRIVEHRPSLSANAVRDHLRLTEPEVPVLYARPDRDVLDLVPIRPFQRCGRSWIRVLTCADFFDDGVWNQDCGSEALDQVEAYERTE